MNRKKVLIFTSKQTQQDVKEYNEKIDQSFEKWFKGIKLEDNSAKNTYRSILHAAYFVGFHNGFKESVDKWLEDHSI